MIVDAALLALAHTEQPIALVTVALVAGSAPRHVGSRMAVRPDGSIVGTVGGGKPEAIARQAALACLAAGRNETLLIDMTGTDSIGPDPICGGQARMWIEVLHGETLYAAALDALAAGKAIVLASHETAGCVAVFEIEAEGQLLAGAPDGKANFKSALAAAHKGGCDFDESSGILYAPVEPEDRLLILGGGHVALALSRIARTLSFRVSVADPRPEYANSERFGQDVQCVAAPFETVIAEYPDGPSAWAVVVSPGHLGDLECARALLKRNFRYVGLIGSRRKARMIVERLQFEGVPRERAEWLRTPIGLDIDAETPEEIAIAIAAELIAVRRNSAALPRIDAERQALRASGARALT